MTRSERSAQSPKARVVSVSRVYANAGIGQVSPYTGSQSINPEWKDPSHYYVVKKVGRGKYSTVFKGLYKRKTEVAIKTLVPLDPRRYLPEIKMLQILDGGPNIVRLLDLLKDPLTGICSIVFEWVEFTNYREIYPKLGPRDIPFYIRELLKALDYSHSLGIMHRDVKPQNVAIDIKKRVLRLLDWGLADFYRPRESYSYHVATRIYKPPELFLKYPYYDYSIDIWCTGMVMAVMLFRRIPLDGAESDEMQLLKLANLMGGQPIVDYADSLGINLSQRDRDSLLARKGTGFRPFVIKSDPSICTDLAMDLLRKLLTIDHRQRPTAKEALAHPYLQNID